MAIVQCVPNFSEGRDLDKIEKIVNPLRGKEGVKLLNYEADKNYNRLVVTVIGEPEKVKNAVADAAAGFENGTKHVFCGPLYNQSGKELVKAGEVYIEPKSSPTFGEVLQGIDIKK